MPRLRAVARALLAATAAGSLAACDNSEYLFPTQSAGGTGSGGAGGFNYTDPAGDLRSTAEGAPDAISFSGSPRGDTLVVTLTFRTPIAPWSEDRPNSLTGFIDFDLDEDPDTGIPAAVDEEGGSTGMGAEYYVSLRDLSGGDAVSLFAVESQQSTLVPARFTTNGVTIRIPRSLLPDTEPGYKVAAVVGHRASAATDFVPNTGSVTGR